MRPYRVMSGLLLVVGLWLLVVPSLLFHHTARTAFSDYVMGAVVSISAVTSLRSPRAALAALGVGVYLALMPFMLGYAGTGHQVHDIVLGLTTVGLSYAIARVESPRLSLRT